MAGVDLLLRLTGNILKNPTESKFRTIKSSIAKIQSTLFALGPHVAALLTALGFMQLDDEHYVFVGDYFRVLKRGQFLIEKAVEPTKVKLMTPEEKLKWDTLQESKRIH